MIAWEDRSNARAPDWWTIAVPHLVRADISRGAEGPWRVAIGWIEGPRDRFDLPAHWPVERVKSETLQYLGPRLSALAERIAAAVRDVANAVDAANAAR